MIRTLSATALLFAAGMGLAPQVASARPCCSACDDNPRICRFGCTPTCNAEDAAETARLIYDEQLGLCYIGN
jgi:hypothetical protein